MRVSRALRDGALAGAAAGAVSALLMLLVTQPVIRRALVVEQARPGGPHHQEPLVSRGLQVGAGAVTAIVAGVLLGVVFAVVFAKSRHRLPGADDRGRALWLAGLGFFAFTLLPALAIPANPPAVGDPATVDERTLLYVLAVLVGLLVVSAVAGLDRLLDGRGTDPALRRSADLVAAVVLATLAVWLLPGTPDSIAADVPADLVWDFRVASLALLGAAWLGLGLAFGLLTVRSVAREREGESVPA